MRQRHILFLAEWVSAATLILAACSDDSATTADTQHLVDISTSSTAEPDSTVKRITTPPTTSAATETTSEKDCPGLRSNFRRATTRWSI